MNEYKSILETAQGIHHHTAIKFGDAVLCAIMLCHGKYDQLFKLLPMSEFARNLADEWLLERRSNSD